MGCILAKHKLKFEDKEGRALAGSREQEVVALRISFYLLICKIGKIMALLQSFCEDSRRRPRSSQPVPWNPFLQGLL